MGAEVGEGWKRRKRRGRVFAGRVACFLAPSQAKGCASF